MKADNNRIQQAIIAREIVDLYRDSQDKIGTAVSLDALCFAMARLTDCAIKLTIQQLTGMI